MLCRLCTSCLLNPASVSNTWCKNWNVSHLDQCPSKELKMDMFFSLKPPLHWLYMRNIQLVLMQSMPYCGQDGCPVVDEIRWLWLLVYGLWYLTHASHCIHIELWYTISGTFCKGVSIHISLLVFPQCSKELLSQKLDMKFMSTCFISVYLGIFCCSCWQYYCQYLTSAM